VGDGGVDGEAAGVDLDSIHVAAVDVWIRGRKLVAAAGPIDAVTMLARCSMNRSRASLPGLCKVA
jgi:hypothetical protein